MGSSQNKDTIKYGSVHLSIISLEQTLNFWQEVIGLSVLEKTENTASLGVGSNTLVKIYQEAKHQVLPRFSGLYHLAVHIADEKTFADILLHLIQIGYPISPTDHIMSKAIYLLDPNGITVEITFETPERFDKYLLQEGSVSILDTKGNSRGITEPLNVNEVLEHSSRNSITNEFRLPESTYIGHVHLYVDDLAKNAEFYEKLGFIKSLFSVDFGFADFSLGGKFKHRLAMNTWQSKGRPQAPVGTAGLKYYELMSVDGSDLETMITGLQKEQTADGYMLTDPAGNQLLLSRMT